MKGVREGVQIGLRILVLCAFLITSLAGAGPAEAAGADPVINEFVFNHTGTDNNEYIEVYGDAETDYSAYTLLEIEGDSGASLGVVDDVIPLGVTDAYGFWWTGFVLNQIENGTVTVLLVEGFTGEAGDDLDSDDDGVFNATPWLRIVDEVAVNDGGEGDLAYTSMVLAGGYDGVSYTPGGASRIPDGADSNLPADWVRNDFDLAGIPGFTGTLVEGEAINTPSAANDVYHDQPQPDIYINEVDADTAGTDVLEFVELYDGGTGNTSLDGLVLVFYNGNGDASYAAYDLDGYSTDANGYFLLGNAGVSPAPAITFGSNGLQNGADAVALYSGDGASFPNGTAVTTDGLIDAVVYDTNDPDDSGLLVLLNPGQPQVDEDGGGDKDAHSNQRCPDGSGGLRNTETFIQDSPTPGAENCFVPPPDIYINEVDADTAGTDVLEFVELYDGGTGNTPLDGLVLVFYNGNGDVSYAAYDLDGYSTDAGGYFLLGNTGVSPTPAIVFGSNGLQNGADAVALYSGDAADFPSGTALTTDGLIDAVVYDTNDSDDAGLLALLNPGQPQLNEDGAGDKDNHSNQRCPDGSGGLRNTDTFIQDVPTPGAANCAVPPEACGDPFTPVYAIQGAEPASLLDGMEVAVEGVVTGDFQAGDELNGFFIQDPTGDNDPSTSDGIFVFAPASLDVAVGDAVRVRGIVDEYYDLTEITDVSAIWMCGAAEPIQPTAVDLPIADLGMWESMEGMLIVIPEVLTVTEHYNLGRFGELLLAADGRLYNPTNDQGATQELNDRRTILLDDASTVQNPADVPYLGTGNTIRLGDVTTNLTGVLSYGFDFYRLQPTEDPVFARVNERTAAPDAVGGTVRVASFNVLNYFTTIDDGTNNARGADSIEEFERQQDKIVEAILAIDADVVGLIEIENNGSVAVENLVAALNAASEPGRYAAIADPPEGLGDDAIKVAIIYQPARVTPVGAAMTDLNPIFDRPPLAQTFDASGEIFSVIVNHFKSKGSCPTDPSDPNADQGDGQGCWNLRRTQQAAQLLMFAAAVEAASADDDVIILGDLNAYGQEDPVNLLLSGGFFNQIAAFIPLAERYSYVFDGQAGYLDHALTTESLGDRVTGVDIWHINADEPRILDYNQEYNPDYLFDGDLPYRSSDHDPVVLGFCEAVPPEITITLTPDLLWPPTHAYVEVEAVVSVTDNTDSAPTLSFVTINSNEPDNGVGDGDTIDDILVVDDFHFLLRAERSGGGTGRVYTVFYVAEDACGNITLASATVTVPRAYQFMRWERLQTQLQFGG